VGGAWPGFGFGTGKEGDGGGRASCVDVDVDVDDGADGADGERWTDGRESVRVREREREMRGPVASLRTIGVSARQTDTSIQWSRKALGSPCGVEIATTPQG
jgi:hypothetical protein